MSSVNTCKVNNKLIEYITENDLNNNERKYIVYNNFNNRTIIANKEVVSYLNKNMFITNESPLYDFIEKKGKKNWLDFNVLSFLINTKYINPFEKIARFTTNNFIVLISLLFTFLVVLFSNNFEKTKITEINNIPLTIIQLYITQFIIVVFHEISHYYFYNKYFQPKYIRFGLTIRYFSLLLFFTSVPFIDVMKKKAKRKLITAGIKTQITIQGILSIFIMITPNTNIINLIFLLNLGIIIINILPLFKLDGYWYLTSILGIKDYMNYYKQMVNSKEKFNLFIFIIGTINIIAILILITYTFYKILQFLKGVIL